MLFSLACNAGPENWHMCSNKFLTYLTYFRVIAGSNTGLDLLMCSQKRWNSCLRLPGYFHIKSHYFLTLLTYQIILNAIDKLCLGTTRELHSDLLAWQITKEGNSGERESIHTYHLAFQSWHSIFPSVFHLRLPADKLASLLWSIASLMLSMDNYWVCTVLIN